MILYLDSDFHQIYKANLQLHYTLFSELENTKTASQVLRGSLWNNETTQNPSQL